MKNVHPASKSQQLSVVSDPIDVVATRLTRAQVAARIGASTSTVRRYEGDRLHPEVDEDGTHWFDPKEVTALAAARANEALARGRIRNGAANAAAGTRTKGEIAALVFERFEQRQSHAEIVIGLRLEPEVVRELFDQWCLGLTEHQLRSKKEPNVQRRGDVEHGHREKLAARLAELPRGITRISVARFRGHFMTDDVEYNDLVELGGFHVAGPCGIEEITNRFGSGDYRVTAYGLDPPGVRWECIVEGLSNGGSAG